MAIDREKLLAWLDDECSREQHLGKAHAIMRVMAKIRSGAFDADTSEVQRLRAIEQAIRDFQPTKEQRAGYDALVAWLESTTTFVLDPNGLTN